MSVNKLWHNPNFDEAEATICRYDEEGAQRDQDESNDYDDDIADHVEPPKYARASAVLAADSSAMSAEVYRNDRKWPNSAVTAISLFRLGGATWITAHSARGDRGSGCDGTGAAAALSVPRGAAHRAVLCSIALHYGVPVDVIGKGIAAWIGRSQVSLRSTRATVLATPVSRPFCPPVTSA